MPSIGKMAIMNGWSLIPDRDCGASRFMVREGLSSPSQRLSLRGRSPSLRAGGLSEPEAGAEPEPEPERTVRPELVEK